MKSLSVFIKEYQEKKLNESSESVTVTLDLSGLENSEETLKSLSDMEGCSVEEEKVTVTVSKDSIEKLGSVQDILQQYYETLRNSSKRSSDEQYAQKIKSFGNKIAEFNEAIDKIENPEEE